MQQKSPYQIVGVKPTMTYEEAKKVYRQACKKYHPDVNCGTKEATEKFKEISESWKYLEGNKESAFGQLKKVYLTHKTIFNLERS